ncbi:SDR family NAD(P)-dependent oxidoreductase [Sphingobium sp. EM0848]|uniref:SDR family NAD(P)-dependent oxidoreductase n=1 Tax=Sphingobium sp. EM0848 TaxID=2743473 RepID=UPI00159C7EFB|nr:SDR family oxidoreductase [Sphingobium sp. EM0848]
MSAANLFSATSFAGHTAVITGGASGIGHAIARQLAEMGCAVAIFDRDEAAAAKACDKIAAYGSDVLPVMCDVTDCGSVDDAIARLLNWRPAVDHLVNSVGSVIGGDLSTIGLDMWRRSFAVNLDSVLIMSQALHARLAASPFGSIVNIASLAGKGAYPKGGGYGPSKAALISLSYQLAIEWASAGIRVNVVNPATTLTPLVHQLHSAESLAQRASTMPLGRLVDPEEVAAMACFLLSPAASAMTAQAIDVDCGMSQSLVTAIKSRV